MYIRTSEGPEQRLSYYGMGDTPASPLQADRRNKRVAALVTEDLKAAKMQSRTSQARHSRNCWPS
jgi:hypothetical protein